MIKNQFYIHFQVMLIRSSNFFIVIVSLFFGFFKTLSVGGLQVIDVHVLVVQGKGKLTLFENNTLV